MQGILFLSHSRAFKQMHNMYPHLLPLSPFDVLFICLVLLVHLAIAKALHFSPSESIKQERPPHRLADFKHPCDYNIVFEILYNIFSCIRINLWIYEIYKIASKKYQNGHKMIVWNKDFLNLIRAKNHSAIVYLRYWLSLSGFQESVRGL